MVVKQVKALRLRRIIEMRLKGYMFNRHLANRNNKRGEIPMRIKYKECKDVKLGNYDFIQVIGTALSGQKEGEEWSTRFFKTAKEMKEVTDNAKAGDILNITMKKNGNYWNPTAIANEGKGGDVFDKAIQSNKVAAMNDCEERMYAMEIASRISGGNAIGGDIQEAATIVANVADIVLDYAHKRGPFAFDTAQSHDIPEDTKQEDTSAE